MYEQVLLFLPDTNVVTHSHFEFFEISKVQPSLTSKLKILGLDVYMYLFYQNNAIKSQQQNNYTIKQLLK